VKQLFNKFIIAFNAQETEKITKNYLGTPVTFREWEKVSLISTPEGATYALEQLFNRIEQKG